ncbi:hypothetical protein AOXY_G14202, partial [Acipenser oxyrinchus oxyrinchus]
YFIVKLQDYTAVEKDEVVLDCELSKDVPVKWFKDEKEIKASKMVTIKTEGKRRLLSIKKVESKDKGDYVCDCGTDKTMSNVNIEVPPTIEVDVKLIEGLIVKAGSKIKLPAIIRGIPVPTAKWVMDGSEIKTEGNYSIDSDNFSTVLNIKDCTRKDTGEYLLTVANPAGSKTVALHLTVLDVPSPPVGPINILEITPDHMVINWRPPKDDGGSPVMNYIVEKRESKKETWGVVSSGSTSTKVKIPRLQKGCEYIMRVRAENKIGIGEPLESQPTVAKHMFDPPAPPGKPVASDITENAVTVSWTMPKSDGGSPISGYIVERREISGKWIRVNKTPVLDLRYRAHGLFEGNTYEFRIFAENMAGISKPSPVSDPVRASRPITPPGPPVNPKLKDWSKQSADLVWTKPNRDGGSPVLGYIIECQKSTSVQWDRINKDDLIKQCAFRVPGLIEGTEYRFRVRAANVYGEGEPRELPESVIAKDILQPPEINLDVTCRDSMTFRVGQTIAVTARVKGRPDPDITWSKDARVLTSDKRTEINNNYPLVELIVKEATRADHGKYSIVAKNSSGQAQAAVVVNVLDRPGPYTPGPVADLGVADITKMSCQLSWSPPENDGGSSVTHYILEKREADRKTWATVIADLKKTSFSVANLVPGSEYYFRVTAVNEYGSGVPKDTGSAILATNPISKFILFALNLKLKNIIIFITKYLQIPNIYLFTTKGEPDPPKKVDVMDITKNSATVAWEPPLRDGGAKIDGYIIDYIEDGQPDEHWTPYSVVKDLSIVVVGLKEGKKYKFRVAARNPVGSSLPREVEGVFEIKEQLSKSLSFSVPVCSSHALFLFYLCFLCSFFSGT